MKFVFAMDSYKGTLTSKESAALLNKAARVVFGECDTVCVSIADGGEGTIDAVMDELHDAKVCLKVSDPLLNKVDAYYGLGSGLSCDSEYSASCSDEEDLSYKCSRNKIAIIEMARASGLTLISKELRNPLYTTSFGTGELVKDAVNRGAKEIFIAIGGSATNDGGMGFAKALGVKFFDEDGNELEGRGVDLERVADIDISSVLEDVKNTKFHVLCDVRNPLCGENGATFTYAKQKGATASDIIRLEKGMKNYRDTIIKKFGVNPDEIHGSGAAGGIGTALKVFFGATLKSGIETVMDIISFDEKIKGADFIITGEGCMDYQSAFGKVVAGVAAKGKSRKIPVIAICGSLGEGYEKMYECGVEKIYSVSENVGVEEAIKNVEKYFYETAIRMFSDIRDWSGPKLGNVGKEKHGKYVTGEKSEDKDE